MQAVGSYANNYISNVTGNLSDLRSIAMSAGQMAMAGAGQVAMAGGQIAMGGSRTRRKKQLSLADVSIPQNIQANPFLTTSNPTAFIFRLRRS